MADSAVVSLSYDAGSDVLYIARTHDEAFKGIEDDYGIVWRYAENGALIGATVMDFREIWLHRGKDLARRLSAHFELTDTEAGRLVEDAYHI